MEGSALTIDIYAKEGCGLCGAAKSKFSMCGLEYNSHDMDKVIQPHEGWREDGSVEVLAAFAMHDGALPLIRIDGEYMNYPGAMRRLKNLGVRVSASGEAKAH